MSTKLEKMSVEKLEKKIAEASTYQKNINTLIIVVIILTIFSLLLGDTGGTGFGVIVLLMASKFYFYPTLIGKMKSELNKRVAQNTSTIINNQ